MNGTKRQWKSFIRLGFLLLALVPAVIPAAAHSQAPPADGDLVLLGWNSLGMHCINPLFADACILPPYNVLMAQVVRKGNPPQVVTEGLTLEYSIPGNTTVAGKTDFWQWAKQLFGLASDLPPGIGLTGLGLSGTMTAVGDHFEAAGIPVLPMDDRMEWTPYQLALVIARNASGGELARARVVIPVSDELNCQKCHDGGADASANYGIDTGSLMLNILAIHDAISGTTLVDQRPVLCGSCHQDNALGTPGGVARRSLSEAMHSKHSILLTIGYMDLPGCYDCHPGALTKCLRTGIDGMGYAGDEPTCPACHGDLAQVGASIAAGREPWIEEPSCSQCHGPNYGTGTTLYRNAEGHGGVYCAACHNSPHAWWPSKLLADDILPLRTQGQPYSLWRCSVCHTDRKIGDSPHVNYLMPFPVKK